MKFLIAMCALIAFCSDIRGQILKQDPETQKWGVISQSSGQWLVLPTFDELGPVVKSERYGFLETEMAEQWIVPVKADGLWGIMDASGKMKIKPKYESIGKVLSYKKTVIGADQLLNTSVLPVKYNGVWGIVDTKGKECIKPSYEEVIGAFTGKANSYSSDKDGYIVLKNNGIYVTLKANGKPSGLPGFKAAHADENYFLILPHDGEQWVNLYKEDSKIIGEKRGESTVIFDASFKKKPIYVFENNKLYTIKEAAKNGNVNAVILWAQFIYDNDYEDQYEEAITMLKNAGMEGVDAKAYKLLYFINGSADSKDIKEKAKSALKECALKGFAAAEYYYAEYLRFNTNSDIEKLREAITWLDKAQAHGYDIEDRKSEYQGWIDSKIKNQQEIEENRRQKAEQERQEQLRIQNSKKYVKSIAGTWKVKGAGNMITYIIKSDHTYTLQLNNRRYTSYSLRLTATLSGTWEYDEENGRVIIHKPNKLHSKASMTAMPGAPLKIHNLIYDFNKLAINDEQMAIVDELFPNERQFTFSNANTMEHYWPYQDVALQIDPFTLFRVQ